MSAIVVTAIRGALERVYGVARVVRRQTGEWSVDVRSLDPRLTTAEVSHRIEGAALADPLRALGLVVRVMVVTELVAKWRAERLFRAVVVVRGIRATEAARRDGGEWEVSSGAGR